MPRGLAVRHILNTRPRLPIRFSIYVTHAPSFGGSGSSYLPNTPPSFGDSGSSYISSTLLMWRLRFIKHVKHPPLLWRSPFIIHLKHAALLLGVSRSSYILNAPPHLEAHALNTPAHLAITFIIHVKHAPSFGGSGSSYLLNTPLHWRFRLIIKKTIYIYICQARTSCGDIGSSNMLNTPPPLAITVHHTS